MNLSLLQRLQNLVEGLEADEYTASANDVREAIAALNAAPQGSPSVAPADSESGSAAVPAGAASVARSAVAPTFAPAEEWTVDQHDFEACEALYLGNIGCSDNLSPEKRPHTQGGKRMFRYIYELRAGIAPAQTSERSATRRSSALDLLNNVWNMRSLDEHDREWQAQWRQLMQAIDLELAAAGYKRPEHGGNEASIDRNAKVRT